MRAEPSATIWASQSRGDKPRDTGIGHLPRRVIRLGMAGLERHAANLKLLRAFSAVAKHRSFSRAAAELGRSQATVSVQVRELERQLNIQLLERTTRRVALTEAGVRLADAVEVGLAAIDSGLAAARATGESRGSSVVFGCSPSISATLLPTILAGFRESDRATHIDVEELTSTEIIAAILEDRVDFGVGPCIEPTPPEIGFTPVINDPLLVLLPKDHKIGNKRGIPFNELALLPLITLSGSVLLQQMLEKAAEEHGVRLKSQTEVRHVQTAIAMARAGVGAAIVPRSALSDRMVEDVLTLPIDPPQVRRIGLITKAGKPLGRAAAKLARHIRSALIRALGQPTEIETSA